MAANQTLAECRDLLYMGAIQASISKLTSLTKNSNSEIQTEAKILLVRAYLSQNKFTSANSECQSIGPSDLQAAATNLCLYMQSKYQTGKADMLPAIVADCRKVLSENEHSITNPTFVYLSSALLLHAGFSEDSMKLLALHPGNIECFALMVQAYLSINRSDMAEQLLSRSKKAFEDSVIYQLSEAWTNCCSSAGSKAEKAFYSFEELTMSCTSTSMNLLVSQAVAKMHIAQYPEADGILHEALDKDNSNSNVLANLAISSVLNEKDSYSTYVSQLRDQNPNHPFIADLNEKSALFDSCAKAYN
ncbi:Coatomer subunit epsilon [Smittium culicis]|uniref:Coatomer subunit epsilon n=2 Tax=Smittium culicis TaxID=133412 RepID=A0A1R1XH69_9FUNG|nr:Coatomer subunit epsilon [Smittium culicis]